MKSRLPLFALAKLCLLVILMSANLVQSKKKNGLINELQSRYIENVNQNLRSVRSKVGDETMIFNPNIMKELVCKSNWFLKLFERNLSQSLLPLSNKDIDHLIGDIVTILGLDSENFHTNTTNEIMKQLLEYSGVWSANIKYTPDHKMYDEIWNSFTWRRDPKKGFLTSKDALKFITQLHLVLQSSRRSSEMKMLMNFFDQPLSFDHNNPRFRSFPPSKTGNFLSSIKLPSQIKSLIPRGMTLVKAVEEAQNMISFDRKKLQYNLRVLNVRTLDLRLINRRCQSFVTTKPPITQKIVCGEPIRKAKFAGGKKATQGSWPWIVYLHIIKNGSGDICGGSLISDMHILTAAHCVAGATAENVRVYPGSVRIDLKNSPGYEAKNVFIHEDYNKQGEDEHNIALIKIKEKIIFDNDRRPICLPPPNINLDGKIAYIAGWGMTENGTTSNVLIEGFSLIWSNAECNEVFIYKLGNLSISEQQMCMAGDGKTELCKGDSGGPIMYKTTSGQWIVVGIVSHGAGRYCGRARFPSVQTRVSTYLDWINAKLIL